MCMSSVQPFPLLWQQSMPSTDAGLQVKWSRLPMFPCPHTTTCSQTLWRPHSYWCRHVDDAQPAVSHRATLWPRVHNGFKSTTRPTSLTLKQYCCWQYCCPRIWEQTFAKGVALTNWFCEVNLAWYQCPQYPFHNWSVVGVVLEGEGSFWRLLRFFMKNRALWSVFAGSFSALSSSPLVCN